MRSIKLYVGCVLSLSLFLGCKSKFSESEPDRVKVNGLPLQERVAEKAKIDSKMAEVQEVAEKIKKLIDLFKKVQAPESFLNVYTPLDFLLDMNTELKKKIPQNVNGRLVRSGTIILPAGLFTEECRKVNTLLETSFIYEEYTEEKIGERLTYSLNNCKTSEDQFLEVISADWIAGSLELKLNGDNLNALFDFDLISDKLQRNSACKIKQTASKKLDAVSCSNVLLKLSKTETANIAKAEFNNSQELQLNVEIDIFENKKIKAQVRVWQYAGQDLQLEVKKTNDLKSE